MLSDDSDRIPTFHLFGKMCSFFLNCNNLKNLKSMHTLTLYNAFITSCKNSIFVLSLTYSYIP